MFGHPAGQLHEIGDRELLGTPRKEGVLGPAEVAKADLSELRIILRRWPNEAFTTRMNNASSQPRCCVALRRRRMTALLTFGGG